MGVLNVTPDSFSDGGRYLDPLDAVAHAVELVGAGADVIDVGGESTRPGARPVGEAEELSRVLPVIDGVVRAMPDVPVSIDTTKSAVAAAALAAGASIVNDVSAGIADPRMLDVAAAAGAGYVAMHMAGTPSTMQEGPRYHDVVGEVADFLIGRLDAARAAGIPDDALMADPGIGFGKTLEHNLTLLAELQRLVALVEVPVLIGTSRKSFIGRVLGDEVLGLDDATLGTTVWAFERGAAMVRVHEPRSAAHAARLLIEVRRAETVQGAAA